MTRYSLVVIGSMVVIALGLNAFLNRTKTGLGMRAIAINRDIALVFGVNANRMNNLALGIGAGIAAAGGVLIAPILYVTSTTRSERRDQRLCGGDPSAVSETFRARSWEGSHSASSRASFPSFCPPTSTPSPS